MKLKSLVLLAALGAGLTACNNDDNDLFDSNESKSVTISLANVSPKVKGTGSQIANETAVALGDYYIVFTDGTNLYGGYDLGTDGNKVNASKYYDAKTLTKTFHFVDAAATKAIVVGNVGGETGTLKSELDKCTTLAALNALVVQTSGEQEATDLTLYGVGDFKESQAADDEGHTPVYTTEIDVSPLIARVEVTGFNYTGTKYASIALNKIALDNYYPAVTLAGTPNGTLSFANVASTGNSEPFFAGLTTAAWYFDNFTNVSLTPNTEKTAAEILGQDKGDAYVYHVTAGAGSPVPHILLQMVGDPTDAQAADVPLYIVAKGLKDATTSLQNLTAGSIYRLSFEFDDEDLEQPTKCVEVTVEVAKWKVVAVTPEF